MSSRLVHECQGEGDCGFYGLPHVLCVPVPPYAKVGANDHEPLDAADLPATALTVLHADS